MKTKEGVIREDVIVLKNILDMMVVSIPHSAKIDLLEEYKEDMANRNHITNKAYIAANISKGKKVNVSKKKKDNEDKKKYNEQKIKDTEVIRFKVLLKLFDCKYGKVMTNATLAEVGYVLGISREAIRQIENRVLAKFKNPNLLKELDKIKGISDIYEHKELAMEFKKKKEKAKAV